MAVDKYPSRILCPCMHSAGLRNAGYVQAPAGHHAVLRLVAEAHSQFFTREDGEQAAEVLMAARTTSTPSLPPPSLSEAEPPISPPAANPHWHVADYDWDPYTMTATRLVSSSCMIPPTLSHLPVLP